MRGRIGCEFVALCVLQTCDVCGGMVWPVQVWSLMRMNVTLGFDTTRNSFWSVAKKATKERGAHLLV